MLALIDHAKQIASRGWPVLPLFPLADDGTCTCGNKCSSPGKHPINKTGVTGASVDAAQIESWWERYPRAGIGIATGTRSGLLVIDVDQRPGKDGAANLAALGALPDCPTVTTGSGGTHYYLALPAGDPLGNSAGKLAPGIDTRGEGGYVVAPPTRHHSGRDYVWQEFDDLVPPEAPAWLVDALRERKPIAAEKNERGKIKIGRHQWILETAGRLIRWGLSDAAVLAAITTEIPNVLDLSDGRTITPKEITDAIAGARRKGFDEGEGTATVEGAAMAATLLRPKVAAPVGTLSPYLLRPGGILSALIEYSLQTAARPQPELSLAAALAAFAGVIARKVQTPSGIRANLYAVGICESGGGKDGPRKACKRALDLSECRGYVGPDDFASHAAIHTVITHQPSVVCFLDEFGLMLSSIYDVRAPSHKREIASVFLKIYTSSNSRYQGTAYADAKRTVDVDCPALSMFATTTPNTLWQAVTREACEDGLLGRCLLFRVADDVPDKQLDMRMAAPPDSLLHAIARWHKWQPTGNLHAISGSAETVAMTTGATAILHAFSKSCDALMRKRNKDALLGLWVRGHEQALKVALLHACSLADPAHDISIDVDSAQYAVDLVTACITWTIEQARQHVSTTPHERLLASLEDVIRKAGTDGMTRTEIAQAWRKVPSKQRGQLLDDLMEANRIQLRKREHTGPGQPAMIYAVS